jgi:hypothetical protein
MSPTRRISTRQDLDIPLTLLASYLFFLSRRPVSSSNRHYLARRLRGLQSLADTLESGGGREIGELVGTLRRLTPENFSRLSGGLQLQLAAVQRLVLMPPSFVVSHHPPRRWPFPASRRVLIVFGPAIGIGDEIILFPLPAAIRAMYPDVEIVLMSGYPGLWDRVRVVDHHLYYETHAELVEALGGRSLGHFDAVVVADFEKPGLIPAICAAPTMRSYVEISLGAQCAVFADTRSMRIHAVSMPIEVRTNYYEVSEWLLDWLGIPVDPANRYAGIVERATKDTAGPFRIFVSPFTSKHEPSLLYWSKILNSLADVPCGRDVEFVLDPGASLTTERFATSLLRVAGPRTAGRVRIRIAADPGSRTLSLSGVFNELERCDLVVCADSFAAHAGPLFGCITLVMAREGLENWRTPFDRSFYFDLKQPIEDVQRAMARILQEVSRPVGEPAAALPSKAAGLHAATLHLKGFLAIDCRADVSGLDGNYYSFRAAYDALAGDLVEGSGCPAGLLSDANYHRTWPEMEPEASADDDLASIRQLRTELGRWENTNLRKFLRLAAG